MKIGELIIKACPICGVKTGGTVKKITEKNIRIKCKACKGVYMSPRITELPTRSKRIKHLMHDKTVTPVDKPIKIPKDELFCQLCAVESNSVQAAIKAYGITDMRLARNAADAMLAKPDISGRVQHIITMQVAPAMVNIDRMISTLMAIATTKITDFQTKDGNDIYIKVEADMPGVEAIKRLESRRQHDKDGDTYATIEKIELQDKIPAIKTIAEFLGWVKQEHNQYTQINLYHNVPSPKPDPANDLDMIEV